MSGMYFSLLFQFSQEILKGKQNEALTSLLNELLEKKEFYRENSNFCQQLKKFLLENLARFDENSLSRIADFFNEFQIVITSHLNNDFYLQVAYYNQKNELSPPGFKVDWALLQYQYLSEKKEEFLGKNAKFEKTVVDKFFDLLEQMKVANLYEAIEKMNEFGKVLGYV